MPDTEKLKLIQEFMSLPNPGNEEYLKVGMDNWSDKIKTNSSIEEFVRKYGEIKAVQSLLAAIFGNSPYLSHCLLSDPQFFIEILTDGPDDTLDRFYDKLEETLSPTSSMEQVMSILRNAKKQIALLTAITDISSVWPLEKITRTLADFASYAVDACFSQQLRNAHDKGDLLLPHPETPCLGSGLIVLGMGKLGAWELNYSSDIDLIVLFDSDLLNYTGRKSLGDCMVRMARNLIKMMQERTADGYVFRTDLRLRPDPGATPIALSLAAAHTYYESQGQNWERAAMIKARPIAGDIHAGEEFIEFLKPFVWRKFLDFAAIADIQAIKSQIHAHKGFADISLDGHNIKIGRGGIREIEFFCQTQQLIEGGRNPALRSPSTMVTLQDLTDAGKITGTIKEDLQNAYVFLRTLEHRLQMIHDEQTQLLPADSKSLNKLGVFMGYDNPDEFRDMLKTTLQTVKSHYDNLFKFEEGTDGPSLRLVFTGSDDDPETLASLNSLGYEEPQRVNQLIREWHHGRYRCTRTVRAQQLLTKLVPTILDDLADNANPDAAFLRFDSFLKKLPSGVQLFSLFSAHPSLLKLVAKIMGMAPDLADRLAHNPLLLDGVISSDFMDPIPDKYDLQQDLELMLSTARDFQDILDFSRRWLNDLKFRVGVQILHNIEHGSNLGATVAAGAALTRLAEVVLASLLPRVEQELELKHGTVPNGSFAVIAAGKLGSREMTPRSDADLIFVFDAPGETTMTDGKKPIPAGLFYTRLSQRLINSLSALTGEGVLYEVDMRLRPHGKSGPLALSLEGFEKYYEQDAWTWEHLALTRARAVAGDWECIEKADAALMKILSSPRDPVQISHDVKTMQDRLHKEHSNKPVWALKHHPGGIMDLEFICQFLKLVHGHNHPEVLSPNTMESIEAFRNAKILNQEDAQTLSDTMKFYLNLQGLIRLSLKDRIVTDAIPSPLKTALATAVNCHDFKDLCETVVEKQVSITALFSRLLKSQ
ncbi:bifunctional [glutamine synthetase] adenylyltransferase/[glutamine synthetase]-adenylyl-L-tyrosine phosphorylase [Sneathiella sp.]|jgi:glutamate-ammonia-ligase adenylyltransferase|uniref:bifunctional [glutamine synthetase] adenylyltransferase/[glutamine synthetase]-adenylyl-L-tyrosine phosphorylase n=1 Tax=Sneathiella sp. TaxID=1964365 RepID=UPI0039E61005